MRVFIDDFELLRIESNDYIYDISIENYQIYWSKNEGMNQYFKLDRPLDLHLCDKIRINHQMYPIEIGLVTLTDAFDKKFRYEGELGSIYTPEKTTFRVFTPVAKEVYVVISNQEYPMTYHDGIWELELEGDFKNQTYLYKVRLVDRFEYVKDPYTKAASSLGSHIIDWNEAEKIEKSPVVLKNYVDAVIYEGHVRDMSIHLDVKHKGLYQGLIEESKTLGGTVLDYMKDLGVTHLQLLPIFDFDDVFDEDKKLKYNWGYNPAQYFAVEGWYSEKPEDPFDRINALRQVINKAHELGLGVNMDVVYNHVYDIKTFPYNALVPGYFYRHDHDHKMTNGSYCGNDVESRRYMVRKLIVDSILHFVEQFQIDGFRFDLMGLMDIETMHEIESRAREINPSIMLYGEGWHMPSVVKPEERPHMGNQARFPKYGHFNDFYRNLMKGELHGPGIGFTQGNIHLLGKAMQALTGSKHMFTSPNQSINYVECHDNLTYYDKLKISPLVNPNHYLMYQDFANHLIAISQGVPFYHAGQEFYRSKKGVENSYNHPDHINQIIWRTELPPVQKLKELLRIRKKYALYRKPLYSDDVTIKHQKNLIVYTLEDKKTKLVHYIKPDFINQKIKSGDGKLIFSSQVASIDTNSINLEYPGVYIVLYKK